MWDKYQGMSRSKNKCQDSKKQSRKRKQRKSKDKTRCCERCNFCDRRNPEDPICSLTAESVKLDGVCDKIDTTVTRECQSCGAKIRFSSKEEMYAKTFLFRMEGLNGNSTGQRILLCKDCEHKAHDEFNDFLDRFLSYSFGKLRENDDLHQHEHDA